MLLESLRQEVLEANLEVVRRGLVLYTFGNASGIDRESGLVVIKPSGVPYDKLTAADLVVADLNGKVVEGRYKPSVDLATHVVLYKAFPAIGGVVHTHAEAACVWAQARREIPCFGTTHADYFYGSVPLTEPLTDEEIAGEYEENAGHAIVRRFAGIDPLARPGVLVCSHGPFTWGKSVTAAAFHAVVLESIARTALQTLQVNPNAQPVPQAMLDCHYLRKHGPNASYGQR